ncbi:MAG: anthranilate phosphoribosyltransferase [Nitrospinota bacterium]
MDIDRLIEDVNEGKDLTEQSSYDMIKAMINSSITSSQTGQLLRGLKTKGETVDELVGASLALRDASEKLDIKLSNAVDTCGTGGDHSNTFNISTTATFVAAGAGVKIAKHHNRAISSRSGSADLLEELGIDIEASRKKAVSALEEVGLTFIFAPAYHKAVKNVATVRKELKIRTIFNLLGPLTNPTALTRHVTGVFGSEYALKMAEALKRLGSTRAFILHGIEDRLDEASTTCSTLVVELDNDMIKSYKIEPEDLGIKRVMLKDIAGGDSKANKEIAIRVLDGKVSAHSDIVILNGAFIIMAAGLTDDIHEAKDRATASLLSGQARRKLDQLVEFFKS